MPGVGLPVPRGRPEQLMGLEAVSCGPDPLGRGVGPCPGRVCQTSLTPFLPPSLPLPAGDKVLAYSRGCTSACSNISVDLGSISVDILCCESDRCNQEMAVSRPSQMLSCHSCLQLGDDFECELPGPQRCKSTQDRCAEIRAHLPTGQRPVVTLRGCASASFCHPGVPEEIGVPGNISCCGHSLCNVAGGSAAPSPPLLLLLLLLSLLPASLPLAFPVPEPW
ncbi:urokinase plasminogen activator surface receptor-like [Pristis pectinata]|uniref:urokinase plasminogen activator surface receptor-like n=1 Tax=Pristis pectinata TaxID=685728 RepID=UPI00223D6C42|nr:urokinase plasminogen activator surface receptor-like [Pristis pectinata]